MFRLPDKKNDKTLNEAINYLVYRGQNNLTSLVPEWIMIRAFMKGAREFDVLNYNTSLYSYSFIDEDGQLRFRNEELLRLYQVELGRFLGIDIRPSVKMKGWGLDRMRAANIAQVVLDYEIGDNLLAQIRSPFMEQLLQMGCSAAGAWVEEASLFGGKTTVEIMNPGELIPIPFNAKSHVTEGTMRHRYVSYKWLEDHEKVGDKIRRNKDQVRPIEMDWGEMEAAIESNAMHEGANATLDVFAGAFRRASAVGLNDSAGNVTSKSKDARTFCRLTEVWLHNTEGLVTRYVSKAGDVILEDKSFETEGNTVYKPVGMARYYPVGFYGRSYLAPLVPFAAEAERTLQAFFRMLREMDTIGILTLPTSLGISKDDLRFDERPRQIFYSPDPMMDKPLSPGQLQPHSLGTLPQQGMAITQQYMQNISGQSEIFKGDAPGRVDSQAALGLLLETGNVGIEAVGNSIADCFSTVYSAILDNSRKGLTQTNMMTILDLDSPVVGVVLDKNGTMDLTQNPIPRPRDVKINIKSRTPPSKTQRVQEAQQMLQLGVIDPRQFRMINYRETLELPVGNESEYQNWRKARMLIRQLFNDGKVPGQGVTVDTKADDAILMLDEITSFMASPEFRMADAAVKNAFYDLQEAYESMMGGYPEQLPQADEAGMMAGGQGAAMGSGVM